MLIPSRPRHRCSRVVLALAFFAIVAFLDSAPAPAQVDLEPGVVRPRDDRVQRRRPPGQTFPPAVSNGALACTADRGDPQGTSGRDLSGASFNDPGMTNDMCRTRCGAQGFLYSATQFASYCFCDHDYGAFGPSADCTARCSGKPDEICGGAWANSVSASTLTAPATPAPPARGMQCVLDATFSGIEPQTQYPLAYRHTEIQRWEVTGPGQPMNGATHFPVRWTVTGTGTKHTNKGGGDAYDLRYTIGASIVQTWRVFRIASSGMWQLARIDAVATPSGAINGVEWSTSGGLPKSQRQLSSARDEKPPPWTVLTAPASAQPAVISGSWNGPPLSIGIQQPAAATSSHRCTFNWPP